MKLKRTTWGLVITALFLSSFVYLHEVVGKSQEEVKAEKQRQIFDFTREDIASLTIELDEEDSDSEETILKFDRADAETSQWQMKRPENRPASDPAISFLVNLLVEGERDRLILARSEELRDYGLSKPFAKITVETEEDSEPQVLVLGNINFDRKFVYARVNPNKEKSPENNENEEKEIEVILVPIDFKYAVERELEEWQDNETTGLDNEDEDNENEDNEDEDNEE